MRNLRETERQRQETKGEGRKVGRDRENDGKRNLERRSEREKLESRVEIVEKSFNHQVFPEKEGL